LKIARFRYKKKIFYGIVKDDSVAIKDGSIFAGKIRLKRAHLDIDAITLLAPVFPTKIVCVGLNYKAHAAELGMGLPDEPVIFLKPPTSVIGPLENIIYPEGVKRLDYEAELAVVIRKKARSIPLESAADYILGYTCLNDITARDLQKKDIQWTRAKSFDTFCPIGPYILAGINPDRLNIELSVNNKVRQSSNTSDMVFKPSFLVSFISKIMTLMPGDIIATGTPWGVGALVKGDEVEVSIEGVGRLKNKVI
jgi:2-keto-4-pentenoate hydratase/2-oxohepta-3-ene-1,7-dioic acid hydratase in catechol pathway